MAERQADKKASRTKTGSVAAPPSTSCPTGRPTAPG